MKRPRNTANVHLVQSGFIGRKIAGFSSRARTRSVPSEEVNRSVKERQLEGSRNDLQPVDLAGFHPILLRFHAGDARAVKKSPPVGVAKRHFAGAASAPRTSSGLNCLAAGSIRIASRQVPFSGFPKHVVPPRRTPPPAPCHRRGSPDFREATEELLGSTTNRWPSNASTRRKGNAREGRKAAALANCAPSSPRCSWKTGFLPLATAAISEGAISVAQE